MKKYVGIILAIVFIATFGVFSFAQGTDTYSTASVTSTPTTSSTTSASNSSATYGNSVADYQKAVSDASQIPSVSINQASNWVEKKGFDLVHFLQKMGEPFAIIVFILGAFTAMFGALGNGMLVGKGIWAMSIAVIVYTVVLFAPEIMDFVLGWLISK